MARPNFFIVGAPRCGTTAMYVCLRQHPQVFMPEHKEPLFFGTDLTAAGHGRLSEREYVGLFKRARPGQRVGEASTWYLYSERAAREIRQFAADAQIIIMLRNPAEVMHSLHGELVFYRAEPIRDFAEALAAEPDRKRGARLGPPGRHEMLYYRDVVRFSDQVERYLTAFGRDRVKIILADDFARDPAGTYKDVLRFLRVDDSFVPAFARVNESKQVLHSSIQELILRPPPPLGRIIPLIRRLPFAHRLRAMLLAANSRPAERTPMPPQLRRQLTEEFAPEVLRLGALIERDLSAWGPAPSEPHARSVAITIQPSSDEVEVASFTG
jgi:hypothetical protein